MTVVNRFVQAVSHGGAMPKPTLIVVHSAETPLKAGYANSIAVNWFGKAATTSAHFMVDPVEIIRMLSDNVVSYAVGPKANGFTLNIEQAGYARLSRAEWTTPDGLKQLAKVGALIHELGTTRGIPLRWATDAQIRAAATGTPGGVCFHDDIRRVLGGTTHNDPMPNYPRDLLEQAWNPSQEDDMPLNDADKGWIYEALRSQIIDRPISNDGQGNALQLWQTINFIKDHQEGFGRRTEAIQANVDVLVSQVGALSGLVTQLAASGGGLTEAAAAAAAKAGAQAALSELGHELTN